MPDLQPPKTIPSADDALDELPPLDGSDEGDADIEKGDLLDDLDDGGDPLDDSTGDGDPIDASEIDAEGGESGWLVDAEDAAGLDVGGNEIASFEESGARDPRLDFEELGVGDEDFGLGANEEPAVLDAGEEGPLAADEELREQDLPQLDADEEGELDEADLIDPGFAHEREALGWAAQAWESVGAPVDVGAVTAIACAGRGVVVATERGLARVDLEGACEALVAEGLSAPVVGLAAAGDAIAAITETGELVVSRDRGATFRSAWRDRASLTSGGAAEVVFADGALWTRTRGGALLRSGDFGVAWEAVVVDGRTAAIAVDDRLGLVVLVADAEGDRMHVRRGVGRADVSSVEVAAADSVSALIAARVDHLAYAAADGGVALDGVAMPRIANPLALAFMDDRGTLLVAAHRDVDDTTSLVVVAPGAEPLIVADVSGDGRARALVRDDAHGVVWVGGSFGLLALEPRETLSSP